MMTLEEAQMILTDVYNGFSSLVGDLEEAQPFYDKLDKVIDYLEDLSNDE